MDAHEQQGHEPPRSIRAWRELRGMPQYKLAELVGVAPSTIFTLEQGWHDPRLSTAQRIADALGVSLCAITWTLQPREVRQAHRGKKRPAAAPGKDGDGVRP